MALANKKEDGERQSLPHRLRGDVVRLRPKTEIPSQHSPNEIAPDEFQTLNGFQQEGVIVYLLETGNLTQLNKLRPDMDVFRPLNYEERRMAMWTWEADQSETEITPTLEISQTTAAGAFQNIRHTVGRIPVEETAAIMERERQRYLTFGPAMFVAAEPLGDKDSPFFFSAARRYLGVLIEFIRWERESKNKSEKQRQSGKPVIIFDASRASHAQVPHSFPHAA